MTDNQMRRLEMMSRMLPNDLQRDTALAAVGEIIKLRGAVGSYSNKQMDVLLGAKDLEITQLRAELVKYRNAQGDPNRNYIEEADALLKTKDEEIVRLRKLVDEYWVSERS